MKFFNLIVLMMVGVFWSVSAQVQKEAVGTIAELKGKVKLRQPLKPSVKGVVGLEIYEGMKIKTYADSSLKINFIDGNHIEIGQNTQFNLSKKSVDNSQTKLMIFNGSLRSTVKKQTSGQVFSVKTPSAVEVVREADVVQVIVRRPPLGINPQLQRQLLVRGHPQRRQLKRPVKNQVLKKSVKNQLKRIFPKMSKKHQALKPRRQTMRTFWCQRWKFPMILGSVMSLKK